MNLTHETPQFADADPTAEPERRHAIVIGSGFGGLAAAIRLGAKGYRVTILEKLDGLGGRAYVHKIDGFTFDAGPTIITGRFMLDELWRLCGRRIEQDVDLREMNPFYRILFNDGTTFECSTDAEAVSREISKFNAADVEGYHRLMAMSEKIYGFGFAKLGVISFNRFRRMAAAVPNLIWLKAYRSVYGLVSRFIKDERLRIAFSFHPLLIGGSPFRAPSTYCLITYLEKNWGVQFAMGGMGSLVEGLAGLVRRQGGVIRTSSEVEEILIDDGVAKGVRLASGEAIKSDIVISNSDTAGTYKRLVPARWRRRWTDRRLGRMSYSMSVFVWYFGTNRRYEDVPHHMILLGPRFKDHLKEMFAKKQLADDFSLYLYRPTATDPSMAPAGCDSFYALSPVPHLDSGTDWANYAETYRAKIQTFLEERVLPGLGDAVIASHYTTPLDFEDRLASEKGAAFGFEPLAHQAGWFRPHNKSEDVKNLYLVGGGTHPGAGIPGVLASAQVLDEFIPSTPSLCPMTPDHQINDDRKRCREAIRQGSKSFYTASKVLPSRVREPAFALYAFCRLADDWVDDGPADADSIRRLQRRLDEIYEGRPADYFVDRAFADVVERFDMPKCLPEGLIEGLRWDVEGRCYETLDDLLEYAARVAAAVGSMMTILMGERRQQVLARACDLGLAMQLSNIARDVGEDARNGRIYLPKTWLREAGIDPAEWLERPVFDDRIRNVTMRLVETADQYYQRAMPGIANLPLRCRPAIKAAALIYREIGRQLANDGGNSIDHRTVVSKSRKLQLLLKAIVSTPLIWQPPTKPPAPATEFLVNWSPQLDRDNQLDRGLKVIGVLQQRDRARRIRQRGLQSNGHLQSGIG